MLPLVPFDVLIPLTIGATALCLGLILLIVARRTLLEWWSRGGSRVTDEAETLLSTALSVDDPSHTLLGHWLRRGGPGRIDGLVRAVERMAARNGGDRSRIIHGCGIPDQLARIITATGRSRPGLRAQRWTRVAAARAAGVLQLTGAMDSLVRAIDDPDPDVAYAAADAVARLNRPEGADAILTRINARSPLNSARLATFVEGMKCDLTDVFRTHLERDDPQALFWTVTLVGQKKVFELVMQVRRHLESEDPNVRAAACECVGELGVQLTDRWLAPRLHDEKWFVQSHAAKAVGQLGSRWAIGELIELLGSREWWVRQNAADALVQIGPACASDVEEMLASTDQFARNSAVEILERIGWVDSMLDGAARGQPNAIRLLSEFGANGGLGYLENALFTAPEAAVPPILEILEELGDDATFGRLRAAAEQLPDHLRPPMYAVAAEVRGR